MIAYHHVYDVDRANQSGGFKFRNVPSKVWFAYMRPGLDRNFAFRFTPERARAEISISLSGQAGPGLKIPASADLQRAHMEALLVREERRLKKNLILQDFL